MIHPTSEEITLVNQPAPEPPEDHHSTWPSPPLSPISSNPPPAEQLPALRAPRAPRGLLDLQLEEDLPE